MNDGNGVPAPFDARGTLRLESAAGGTVELVWYGQSEGHEYSQLLMVIEREGFFRVGGIAIDRLPTGHLGVIRETTYGED